MAKKILIVDDNEHLRQNLASILQFSGYEISEAATGTQAIEKADSTLTPKSLASCAIRCRVKPNL